MKSEVKIKLESEEERSKVKREARNAERERGG